jgi:hypothetical protein
MTPAKASFTPSLTRAPRLENSLGRFDPFGRWGGERREAADFVEKVGPRRETSIRTK